MEVKGITNKDLKTLTVVIEVNVEEATKLWLLTVLSQVDVDKGIKSLLKRVESGDTKKLLELFLQGQYEEIPEMYKLWGRFNDFLYEVGVLGRENV